MLEAVMFGHKHFQPVIQAIIKLAEKAAKEPWDIQLPDKAEVQKARSRTIAEADLRKTASHQGEAASARIVGLPRRRSWRASRSPADDANEKVLLRRHVQGPRKMDIVRGDVLEDRAAASTAAISTTVRPIVSEVHVLPRTHGSALFTRGETQALVVATLGTGEDEQFVDELEGTRKETLPAALQLPALLRRRDGPHGLARSPRNRPRQARLARDPSDACRRGEEFPYTIRRRVGDHRVERLPRRWPPCAAPRSR